ncbi:MAG: formyltetrahydrofolate deformylase, partial [Elusimicrobia bacterium]|nr:formyltetrahydrofolate deformylase [Elusimicrobiota bacterium]
YEQAHARGVKIIGATSHYVTEELDEGPIIEQDVVRIFHRESVETIKKKGQDLEKVVLNRALSWHIERRILVYGPDQGAKTVIFN